MRKRALVLAMCLCIGAATVACGDQNASTDSTTTEAAAETGTGSDSGTDESASSSEQSMEEVFSAGLDDDGFASGITAADKVSLYDYKSVTTLPAAEVIPSDEDVQAEIDKILSSHSTTIEVKDRAVQDGDTINMDYTGYIDDVAFEGGADTDYTYNPSVTTFIDGFYEQIIGHTPSEETFSIQVTFPEDYGKEELNGKEARFDIVLHYIEEEQLSEFNDDFVNNTLGEDMTADEYRQQIKDDLQKNSSMQYLFTQIIDNSTVNETPEELIQKERKIVDTTNEMTAAYSGKTLEEYYESQGVTEDVIADYCTQRAQQQLIVQAIAENEGIKVTDEDMTKYYSSQLDSIIQYYGKGYAASMMMPTVVMENLIGQMTVE